MKKLLLFLFISLSILFAKAQCNEPTNLALTNCSFYGISWDSNGASNWDIEYDLEGFTPSGIPIIQDFSYSSIAMYQMTLQASTYYDFYIRADCGTSTSDWVGPFTFYHFEMAGDGGLMLSEDFELGYFQDYWSQSNQGTPTTGLGLIDSSLWDIGNFANNDSYSAKIQLTGDETNEWLISPLFGFPSDTYLLLAFDFAITEHNTTNATTLGTDDFIQLVYSYDLGETWQVLKSWDSNSIISNTGDNYFTVTYLEGLDMYKFLFAFWASSGTIDDANVDFFIDNINIRATLGIDEFEYNNELNIFPNPVEDTFNILDLQRDADIRIYNSMGQLIKSLHLDNSQNSADVRELEKGMYFLQIFSGQQIYNSRFIKK